MHRMFFGGGRGGGSHRFGHRGHHRGRGGHDHHDGDGMLKRILGHGDLRYVILALLEEKPCHGYELIKILQEKSAGQYSPSPGVVYPTLTFLEEGGYATSTSVENKKQFAITPEGKALLDENREAVNAIFERLTNVGAMRSKLRDWFGREEWPGAEARPADGRSALRQVMHALKAELYQRMPISKEDQKKISEIVERAIAEIRALK